MDALVCTIDQHENATVAHVHGDLDLAGAAMLRETLIGVLAADPVTHLIVDLSDVVFLDSTGIGVLVGAHKRVVEGGGRFTVVVTTPAVRRALQTMGLLRAWRVTASVDDAFADV